MLHYLLGPFSPYILAFVMFECPTNQNQPNKCLVGWLVCPFRKVFCAAGSIVLDVLVELTYLGIHDDDISDDDDNENIFMMMMMMMRHL